MPWRRQWHPTPVLLPGKSHGWRNLVGCSPWGCKESDTTERLHFHFSLSFIGEGNGNPLQCSCLENPRDGGAWWAAVYGVTKSRTWLNRLSSSSSSRIRPSHTDWAVVIPRGSGFHRGSDSKEPACTGTWVQSLCREDPLEKGTAAHSSIPAWRMPWTEEPGGLQSMRSQRVGPDWVTNTYTSWRARVPFLLVNLRFPSAM